MPYSVKINLDSISSANKRIITWELTYPRFIHSELMTHRGFSKCAASSRAIPIKKTLSKVWNDPAYPIWWGKNQAGMQAKEELTGWRKILAQKLFFSCRYFVLIVAWLLSKIGLHKQIVNRILEPWSWITVIVTSTEHDNFFALRDHPDAQPELAKVAKEMRWLYDNSEPEEVSVDGWHLPYLTESERDLIDCKGGFSLEVAKKVSMGRCARVSYLTHDGRRDIQEDIKLHDKMVSSFPPHHSPAEHLAQALENPNQPSGNFFGWKQYRKELPNG